MEGQVEGQVEGQKEYREDERNNSYLATNQHLVKLTNELRSINEQAALNFDRRKNPAEYDLKEKQEMLEAMTEAFRVTNWNSANERRQAADDIAQNLYQPMYPRMEIAEAAAQHKIPEEFLKELKKEKIEHFELKINDESGTERLEFQVHDIETAQRMVEKSNGKFHVVSTKNLDHYRDQFADALYSSRYNNEAEKLMESSLDDAIRYYNGDLSRIRRWDEPLEGVAGFRELEGEEETSERWQTEGQLKPSYQEMAAFRNLESMDEYQLEHEVRDLLNEKLKYTQEYLTDLQVIQHPDAKAVAQVQDTLHEMSHEAILESVEKSNEENFVQFLRHIESVDWDLRLEMKDRNGFVGGENYRQPKLPEDLRNLESISNYAQEVREKVNEQREEISPLHYDITEKLLERLETRIQMAEEWNNSNYNPETAEYYRVMRDTVKGLEYMTRAEDPVFWKMCDTRKNFLEPQIQIFTENRVAEGIKDWQETNENNPEAWENIITGLSALKYNAREDFAYAAETRDHQLYLETLDRINTCPVEYAEILHKGKGEIWVEEKPEQPVEWLSVERENYEAKDFSEKKQLYLEQATEFSNQYSRALEENKGSNNEVVLHLADDLLRIYDKKIEEMKESRKADFDMNFRGLDETAKKLTALLQEEQNGQ